jgi:YidC/Oxa1 family membrane protein insertase
MDRTSIIAIIVCFALMGLWVFVVIPKYTPPPNPAAAITNAPARTSTATNLPEAPAVAPGAATSVPVLKAVANTNAPEDLIEVTNAYAHYTFTSHGGGLKLIELLKYPETVPRHRKIQTQTNRVATLNPHTPAPTLALLGDESVQGDGIYTLTRTATGVRAEKALTNGLTIVKEFQVGTNYLLSADVRLENRTSAPLKLSQQEWVVGTATPMGAQDNGQMVGVMWYDGSRTVDTGSSYFAPGCSFLGPARPGPTEFHAGASNVVWVAVHNQFFALVLMPQQPGLNLLARRLELPRPTGEDARMVAANAPPPQGYETTIVHPGLVLSPNQSITNQVHIYAGPKEYRTLARIAARLDNNLDLVMNFGRFAGFFSKILLLGMNWVHGVIGFSYGWVIITITILLKLIFWPLTQASTRSMKRMQSFQPQLNAIKEKYKDDPMKAQKKTMEFMKEHKISPLGGCLPMVLQVPVFIGFFAMIQSAIELRGEHWMWVNDLSQPDTLFVIRGLDFIPFFGIAGVGLPFNLLPLIMAATMLWQSHLTPPSPGMDPAQAKMMRYMPLIFMVFLYRYSAALTLYWTVQNLLTILQTKLTRTTTEPATPTKGPVLTPPQKKRK